MMATSTLLFGNDLWSMIIPKLHKMVVWDPDLFEGSLAGMKQNFAGTVAAQGTEYHGLSPGSNSILIY